MLGLRGAGDQSTVPHTTSEFVLWDRKAVGSCAVVNRLMRLKNPATSIGVGEDGIVLSGLRYEASTICSKEAWSMTWLLTSVVSIKRSETWKWRAAAWMSSSPGLSVLMYA